jgi:hypothetical protein
MIGFERLHHESVADALHLFTLRNVGVARGDEEYRNIEQIRVGAQLATEIETVLLRHKQIGQNEIWPLSACERQRTGSVAGFDDFVPRKFEELPQDGPQDRFIVDEENLLHAGFLDD